MFKKFIAKFKKDNKKPTKIQEENIQVNEKENVIQEHIEETNDIEFENEETKNEEEKIEEITQELEKREEEQTQKQEQKVEKKLSFFAKLKKGLTKTREGIAGKIDEVLKSYKKVDEELFEELEEILITSDAGVHTTMEIIDKLRSMAKERKITEAQDLKELLKEILGELLDMDKSHDLNVVPSPAIILMVGVNGVGKTTSIGKIAHQFKSQGKKVLLAAGDTFRAAAIDQLEIWGDRVGVDVIKHQEGADPAAVIYDAIQSAKARKIDVLICDTAGRLHNKKNLMNELGKVAKVVDREYPEAKKETLLVLDATTGQNAIQQAKIFKEVTNITGVVLTKLDGTAKGGVVLGISSELDIPVKLIGVGEGMDDLQKFIPQDFVNALFEEEN
ncbi:signal recognition particle-docking protein FtsY [Crassaminicella indica]|uniref:Signal recognition particle receptor FtsY n=1 Tax=Crassaminicella indica TaxID=2855394 RepID=A0ABX8RA12_9CLOT|nr:signal recognition particle-docking protein FtsY [Crassaminicella indica]QXM05894.1 signal recognition particle-docking protein FtsY [Crassaminicella indica]